MYKVIDLARPIFGRIDSELRGEWFDVIGKIEQDGRNWVRSTPQSAPRRPRCNLRQPARPGRNITAKDIRARHYSINLESQVIEQRESIQEIDAFPLFYTEIFLDGRMSAEMPQGKLITHCKI